VRRLALLPLVLLAAGCGAQALDADEMAEIAENTTEAGSSGVEVVEEKPGEHTVMTGSIDFESREASFTLDVDSKEDDVHGVKILIIGNTVYFESSMYGPIPAKYRDKVKPWLSFDIDSETPSLEQLIIPFPFVDPARVLDLVRKVSGDVELVAEEDVRGVPTDRYRTTVDLERVVDAAPAEDRAALPEELAKAKSKTWPIELWIDDEGLVRRFRETDVEEKRTATIDFFDFGAEVDAAAPPKDQVGSEADFFFGGEEVVEGGSEDLEGG
jgi:hypothetical protein